MIKKMQKSISIILMLCFVLMSVQMPFVYSASVFEEDTVIELEDTKPADNFSTVKDNDASGKKYIIDDQSGSDKLTDPDSKDPEISVTFNTKSTATYYVWMRYSCANNGYDSFFIGFNDDSINSEYGTSVEITGDNTWAWQRVLSGNLQEGKNTLKIYHREPGLKMDCVYITADANWKPESADSGDASEDTVEITPIGTVYALENGSVIIEAEDTASEGKIEVVSNSNASGKKAFTFNKVESGRVDNPKSYGLPAATYSFKVTTPGIYYVWIRAYAPNNSCDSVWSCFDNGTYLQGDLTINESDFVWTRVNSLKLDANVHTFNIVPREQGQEIDRILITNKSAYVPDGMGAIPTGNEGYQTLYPTPPILPPSGHPRVYLTADDIGTIKANLTKPQNELAYKRHLLNLENTTDGSLSAGSSSNFSASILGVIESRAFDYVLNKNTKSGKSAISAMRNYCDTLKGGDYNTYGQVVFTIGLVYDWCYDLLSKEDMEYFTEFAISCAAQMEIGYPPTKQGAVTGHGVEGQLMRDLMSLAIATYDERPDIYTNVAGRFFQEFIDPKLFMYEAHSHNQGVHYMSYRYQWEILTTWLFDRMGVSNIFGEDQQYTLYWALYARRPDGQLLRDGDQAKNNLTVGTYDTNFYRSMIHAGNYFNDPYLKMEGARELANFKAVSPSSNQTMNCVEFLVFNNPDLEPRGLSELPLTMYYPSPKGAMIARTGWQDGFDSPAVVCEMKINEYWFANHQHLDAGAFQIYYKGALANDTGYYQAKISNTTDMSNNGNTGYGSQHFSNYHRRSVAHNVITVYDPNEPSSNFGGGVNDGGQRMPNNGHETTTLDELLDENNGYKTAEILGHEFGPDPIEPNYTYLKGDLSDAYSDKVSNYERSFMFLNLKDSEHPAALIVFDRVISSDASFKKAWLLHGLQEPEINGNRTVFKDTRDNYNGKLTVDTLIPSFDNLAIEKIGGPGKEFWVNGTNFEASTVDGGNNEGGGWRIEVSPKAENNTDYFLNVLQVGDANPDMPALDVQKIETEALAGAVIADRAVIFSKQRDRTNKDVSFSFTGDKEYEITVCDLQAGTWSVYKDSAFVCDVSATKDGGVIVYNGSSGNYTLKYKNSTVTRDDKPVSYPEKEGITIRVANKFIYTDVEPTIINDRTLVPMRAIFEKLGVTVTYDDATATASATKDGREVKITENSKTAYIDSKPVELDVPAMIINGRFLVPVRFVSEAFYATVTWEEFAKIVNVTPGVAPASGAQKEYITIQSSAWDDAFEDGVGPYTYDNDTETLWSVDGYEGHWISYDLGTSQEVKGMSVMWNKGDERQAYFDVEISDDNKTWTKVLDDKGSGKAAYTFEDYTLPAESKARYVKINVKGNSISSWNAIIEIRFF